MPKAASCCADVLWYCNDRFKPKFMIDLATLTGAIWSRSAGACRPVLQ
jgi:leucyl aminopeptidase